MRFFLQALGVFVAVAVAVYLVPGIVVISNDASWISIAIIAIIIALFNISIKPILQLLGLPISILTLGIFYLVINTALLYLAAAIANALFGTGFYIESFGSGFIGAIIISIVSAIMNAITGANNQ